MWKQTLVLALSVALVLGDYGNYRTKTAHSKKGGAQTHFASLGNNYAAPKPAPFAPQPAPFAAPQPEAYGPPSPYSFGYEADGSGRQESADASGKVTGSYTVMNEDGSKRKVSYIADELGFRAQVDTDEPGTKSDNPADVQLKSSAKVSQYRAPVATKKNPTKFFAQSAQQSHFQAPFAQEKVSHYGAEDSAPSPYAFSYDSQMADGSSSRSESADGSGRVVGSYSLSNADGRRRTVEYTADDAGFQASVNTNEFGTKSDSPADVKFSSSAAQPEPAPFAPAVVYNQPSYQQSKAQQYTYQQESFQPAAPYAFEYGYDLEDGGSSFRKESSDGSGKVSGSYKFSVPDGRERTVEYTADHEGFKATVNTNEFGTKSESPSHVMFYSSAPQEEPAPYKAPSAYASFQKSAGQAAKSSFSSTSYPQPAPQAHFSSASNGYQSSRQESYGPPSPYSFGYEADGSGRQESADASGKVTGSYTVMNEDGSKRLVKYVADELGFRAQVDTDEPGTKSDNPADVQLKSSAKAPELYAPSVPKMAYAKFSQEKIQQQKFHAPIPQQSFHSASRTGAAAEQKPLPYSFSYQNNMDDGSSSHKQSLDNAGNVVGSYSLATADGQQRTVEYTAGEGGFRAQIKTNEFGTKSESPADVSFQSSAPVEVSHKSQGQQQYKQEKFPTRTFTAKSPSMISQESIY